MNFEFTEKAVYQEYFSRAHIMVRRSVKEFVDKEISMAKNFASTVSDRVTYDTVQIFGGYGFMRGYPVERLFRDNRVLSIGGGPTEIM
jgi:alkylation response protein AidB-like acyl-CoA dehydrogenase